MFESKRNMVRLSHPINSPVRILIGFVLILNISGCTFLGYGTGSLIEKSAPEAWDVTGCRLDSLDIGTRLTVVNTAGKDFRGAFTGFGTVSDKDYKVRYNRMTSAFNGEAKLPGYGEKIAIATKLVRELHVEDYIYYGFEFDYPPSANNIRLRLKQPGSDRIRLKSLNRIQYISNEIDYRYYPDTFRKLAKRSELQYISALVLTSGSKEIFIPLDEIVHTGVLDEKTSAVSLATYGAIFDSVMFFTFLMF